MFTNLSAYLKWSYDVPRIDTLLDFLFPHARIEQLNTYLRAVVERPARPMALLNGFQISKTPDEWQCSIFIAAPTPEKVDMVDIASGAGPSENWAIRFALQNFRRYPEETLRKQLEETRAFEEAHR